MKQKAHRDVFAQIKDRVSIVDVFTTYGITINRHNKALCPFHHEKTPSMMVYPDTNSFYCYGCGVGGDSVTLIDKLFHLEPLEAAKKLDADFSLQLFNHQLSEAEQIAQAKAIEQRKQNQHVVTQFKQWEHTYYGYLCNQIKLLENLIEIRCPTIQNPVITDDFAQSINRKQILEYHCDILSNGALDEKIALYAKVNKEVNNDKRIS